jgi:hypothetical protein
MSNYSSLGQKLSQQSVEKQLKGWKCGCMWFFEPIAKPKGESLRL